MRKYVRRSALVLCCGLMGAALTACGSDSDEVTSPAGGGGGDPVVEPFLPRVHIEQEAVSADQIADGVWCAVGINRDYAIQRDGTMPCNGKASYRFELKDGADNTLGGYGGSRKGRAELCYCYATHDDFGGDAAAYERAVKMLSVYHHGKGIIPQGATSHHSFSLRIPREMSPEVHTIFAQIHGMPDRTLVRNPQGEIFKMTEEEFLDLLTRMYFKSGVGYDIASKHKNGWKVESGGYPPLSFGISKSKHGDTSYVHLVCNSDRKIMSDLDDRTLANPDMENMESVTTPGTGFKTSTMVWKMPFADFPRDCWVRFDMTIHWSRYTDELTPESDGMIDLWMSYESAGREVRAHMVKNEKVKIGRNDDQGYYFKFGIYRTASSEVPVCYHLGDYTQTIEQ